MRSILWPLLLLFLVACASQEEKTLPDQELLEWEAQLSAQHPAAYFDFAQAVWKKGDKQRAAIMFYVGQIRYRAYLNTLPEIQAVAEEQKYEALKSQLGEDINQYAGRNLDNWIRMLDAAVQWHNDNPSVFLPKEDYRLLYELTLYNFNQLRDYIAKNKKFIREQRAQQGLPND